MEPKFTISTLIAKKPSDVFKAVAQAQQVSQYFVDKSSGDLAPGVTVTWTWNKYGDEDILVHDVIADEKITLEWNNYCGDRTHVTMKFENHEEGTLFQITETGWSPNEKSLKNSYDNCAGWQAMSSSLQAYLEHGVSLKSGTVCDAH